MFKSIFFITNTSYTLYSLRLNLMLRLKGENVNVIAGAPRDKYSGKLIDKGLDFYDVPMSQTGMNVFQELQTILSLIMAYKKVRPDIVHLYSVKAIVWGLLASNFSPRINFVATFTGMGFLRTCGRLTRFLLFLVIRVSHRRNKKYVFQNSQDLIFFEQHTGIKGCSHLIRGSGVDTGFFACPLSSESESAARVTKFLMFSRLLKSKGVLDYLNAVKKVRRRVPDLKAGFSLLGGAYPSNPNKVDSEWLSGEDFIEPNVIKEIVNEAGVTWYEHDNNVLPYLISSDIVVLPSYYTEGLPRSLLEAMSCENAVLTTDTAGCQDVVDGSNGILVPPKDVDKLAEALASLALLSTHRLEEMKKSSRQLVRRLFSDEIVIDSYLAVYRGFYG